MARDQSPRGRARSETIDEFMDRSGRELRTFGRDARAAAHRSFNEALREGVDLPLRQPSDLVAFGAQLLRRNGKSDSRSGAAPQTASSPASRPVPPVRRDASSDLGDGLWEGALQADTAVRSAANTLTFHGADHLAAGMNALLQPGGLAEWRRRYEANLANERLRNSYDAAHRPLAQAVGSLAGAGLGMSLMGPMEGALAAAPRLPGAAALTAREVAGITAGGGAAGLGIQELSDLAAGRRSSAGDDVAAVAGGATGALALPLGPARAGAVQSAVTSTLQDILNDRPVSAERAGQSALLGHLFGGLGGVGGRRVSNDLPMKAKGQAGEIIGDARRIVNGYGWRPLRSKVRDHLDEAGKRYWIPDDRSGDLRFEDKFGIKARLTGPQKMARAKLGSEFHLTHTLPADVGKAVGLPAAAAGPQIAGRRRGR